MLARQWLALSSPVPKQVGVLAILHDPGDFSGLQGAIVGPAWHVVLNSEKIHSYGASVP